VGGRENNWCRPWGKMRGDVRIIKRKGKREKTEKEKYLHGTGGKKGLVACRLEIPPYWKEQILPRDEVPGGGKHKNEKRNILKLREGFRWLGKPTAILIRFSGMTRSRGGVAKRK